MKPFRNFGLGADSFFKAWSFLFRNGLWYYIIITGVICLLLFIIIFVFGWSLSTRWSDGILEWMGLKGDLSGFMKVISFFVGGIFNLLFRLAFLILYLAIYKTLVLIVISPFLALLSEKIDEILNNRKFPFSFSQLIKDSWRGIVLALRNFLIEILFIILFFLVSFIPLIGIISPILLLLVSSYFLGFSFIDYSCERYKMKISGTVRFVSENKGLAISTGMFFNLLMLIPFVGILFAPSVSVTATTLAVDSIVKKQGIPQ